MTPMPLLELQPSQSTETASASGGRALALRRLWISVALAVLVLLAYWPIWFNAIIFCDDPLYVRDNAHVAAGVTANGVAWAFRTMWAANWHPLTWLSLMVDEQLWGPSLRAHHVMNVLLHTATSILLFLVLTKATGRIWLSAFVAAIFAVHPLHVESVAWAAERKDVLCA